MELQDKVTFLKPRDVAPASAYRVLSFLNEAEMAQEIVDAVRLAGGENFSMKAARNILNKRARLGEFRDLGQVAAVPRVGRNQFTRMVNALATTRRPGKTHHARLDKVITAV